MNEIEEYKLKTLDGFKNKEKANHYYNKHHNNFNWSRLMIKLELRSIKKSFEFFKVDKNDMILDVPCGTGVSFDLLSKFKCKVTGVDISTEMLMFAKIKANKNLNINLLSGDITDLKLNNNFARGSIILGFFHRVPDEIKSLALKELFRVNKEFIICSFAIDSFFQKLKRKLIKFLIPHHLSAPNPLSLKKIEELFNINNFTIIKKKTTFPFLSSEIIIWAKKN
jgi:ubiquinone/menaquinone biosynthesis C-methylase UbiE